MELPCRDYKYGAWSRYGYIGWLGVYNGDMVLRSQSQKLGKWENPGFLDKGQSIKLFFTVHDLKTIHFDHVTFLFSKSLKKTSLLLPINLDNM
jgi:hypothetical protein